MKAFVKSCLSERDGTVSFGRCISLLIVAVVLTWDTAYIVFAMRHYGGQPVLNILPDSGMLAAQGIFMTLFYGVNKVNQMLTDRGQQQ